MGHVIFVGAGPGAADLITLRGAAALGRAEVVLCDALTDPALRAVAPNARWIDVGKRGYTGARTSVDADGGGSVGQSTINALLVKHATESACVVRLKGGDPSIFGRLEEEIEALVAAGIPFEIVPGVTAALAAAAATRRPLTRRGTGRTVAFATVMTREGPAPIGPWAALAAAPNATGRHAAAVKDGPGSPAASATGSPTPAAVASAPDAPPGSHAASAGRRDRSSAPLAPAPDVPQGSHSASAGPRERSSAALASAPDAPPGSHSASAGPRERSSAAPASAPHVADAPGDPSATARLAPHAAAALPRADTEVCYMAGRLLGSLGRRLFADGWGAETPVSVVSRAGWPDVLQSDHTVATLGRASVLHAGRPTVVMVGVGAEAVGAASAVAPVAPDAAEVAPDATEVALGAAEVAPGAAAPTPPARRAIRS